MPSTAPAPAPISEMTTDSQRTIARTCARVMPTARSRPSSRVRSKTDSARVLTMPSRAMTTASSSITLTNVEQLVEEAVDLLLVPLPVEHLGVRVAGQRRGDRGPSPLLVRPVVQQHQRAAVELVAGEGVLPVEAER